MKHKIKLLVITHTFPTKYNPIAAIFLLNQLEVLKKYCDIKVIFPYAYVPKIRFLNPYYRFSQIPSQEKIKGISVYHPKYFMIPRILFNIKFLHIYLFIESFFSYIASKKTAEIIVADWNPDIIHLHGSLSEGLLGVGLKRKHNKPLLITVYGEDITRFAKQAPSSYLAKFTLKNSDVIICQSEFLENEIKKIGLKNKKFFIIPMGALTSKFKPRNKNSARNILNLPKNKKIILFVGHLVTRKGVEYLIKAMGILIEKDKNILCCVIGKGELDENLRKLSSELNIEPYILFLGQKTNEEVVPYMNACDILVLPSLNEGLPVILCEALACGKPVVATNVAGNPEVINKDVGYLVKPKDENDLAEKIELALNKRWNIKKILERAKKFSVSSSAKKLFNVYNSLLKK